MESDTDIACAVSIEELIAAFGIVIVFLEGAEILILRIRKSCTADITENALLAVLCIAFRAHFVAAQCIQLELHFLDTAASGVDIVAEITEHCRIFIGILIILFAQIREDFDNTLLLIEDLTLQVVDLRNIGNFFGRISACITD